MKVYEFWLKDAFRDQAFEALAESFYNIGGHFERAVDGAIAGAVYAVSRNLNTHWVQLLVDDNTPPATLTTIEARINGLSDDEPMRAYTDPNDHVAPMERRK